MASSFTGAACELVRSLIIAIFVAAGTLVGAVGGLLSGIINRNGMMQGTVMGVITGCLISLELAESLLSIWTCNDYTLEERIRRTLQLHRLLLQEGNFLRGGIFVTISSALESHIDVLLGHSGGGEHGGELFEPSDPVMPMPRDIFHSLPEMEITTETAGQQTTCTICLHEFQAGENATRLPACSHVFHLACIDNWFMYKSDCPVCRRPAYTTKKHLL